MNRELSTVVFTLLLLLTSQSTSIGKLTPLVPAGAKNNQLEVTIENQAVSPVFIASNQPVADTIYDDEYTTEIKSSQACPECNGSLLGSRWCDNNNGTVTDLKTGLTWLKDASWGSAYPYWSDSIDGTNAFERAAQVETGNPELLNDNSVRGDWRLPTISELKELTSGPEGVSSSNMQVFIDVQPDWYWSATDFKTGSDSALNVGMHFGDVSNSYKAFSYHVWPVRSSND